MRIGDVAYKGKLCEVSLTVDSLMPVARLFEMQNKFSEAAVVAELRMLLIGRSYIELGTSVLQALDLLTRTLSRLLLAMSGTKAGVASDFDRVLTLLTHKLSKLCTHSVALSLQKASETKLALRPI